MEIMRDIVNVRHLIDEKDNINPETIESYYKFIRDYQ